MTSKTPKAPAWLSKDAKAEWRRVAPILMERGTLTLGDLATLANYCVAVARCAEAQRIIAEQGLIVRGSHGPRKHPACAVQADAMTQARQLAVELGLTPVSRSRPAIREPSNDDTPSPLA